MQLETTKKKAKGDRLGWAPLKDVKPVKLNADTIRGKVVDVQTEAQRFWKRRSLRNIFASHGWMNPH